MTKMSRGLKVNASGKKANYKPKTSLHSHSHYEILIILKGGGSHKIDKKTHTVCDNQLFLLSRDKNMSFYQIQTQNLPFWLWMKMF